MTASLPVLHAACCPQSMLPVSYTHTVAAGYATLPGACVQKVTEYFTLRAAARVKGKQAARLGCSQAQMHGSKIAAPNIHPHLIGKRSCLSPTPVAGKTKPLCAQMAPLALLAV